MLGVVIWTCQRTGQAIVLCSDGRDLAHFDGPGAGNGQERVAAGDLVEMSFCAGVAVRRCAPGAGWLVVLWHIPARIGWMQRGGPVVKFSVARGALKAAPGAREVRYGFGGLRQLHGTHWANILSMRQWAMALFTVHARIVVSEPLPR